VGREGKKKRPREKAGRAPRHTHTRASVRGARTHFTRTRPRGGGHPPSPHPRPHTYVAHPHARRGSAVAKSSPEASRVLHFYSALSFFPAPGALPRCRRHPSHPLAARGPANERAHNRAPSPPAPRPRARGDGISHSKRSPASRSLSTHPHPRSSIPSPHPRAPPSERPSRISARNIKHGSYPCVELHTPLRVCASRPPAALI